MKNLTVFTPTYNRAKTLPTLYQSLCKQNYKNFKWLIIDDGSTDNTKEIVENWSKEGNIEIQYIKQENGGKYKAINTGVKNCDTELFSFIDSDDYFLDNSLAIMMEQWEKVKYNLRVAGIVGRREDKNGVTVGKKIDIDKCIINENSLTNKYGYIGDTCRMYRTEILKKHLYPEIKDKFIPELVMLLPINDDYDIYFLNVPLSVTEYLEDGYTKNYNELLLKNPTGYWTALNVAITLKKPKITYKIKYALSYVLWSWNNNINNNFKNCNNKALYIVIFPIAYILYVLNIPKWYNKNKKNIFKRLLGPLF